MKPVRLSSADLSKVSFPTLKKTDAQNSNFFRSNDPLGVKISERIFPKDTPPVAQWVQDFSSPPPRWDLAFSTLQLDMMTPINFRR